MIFRESSNLWNPNLIYIIIFFSSASAKREIALRTLGQLVESTGYVVEPYIKYPTLLEVLLNFLKTEQNPKIRRETLKVIGYLGALDPYRHKLLVGAIEARRYCTSLCNLSSNSVCGK